MFFYLGRPWTLGILAQHWWSFAGDDSRPAISRTDIQYVFRRQIPGAWSIGMGPTITIDWNAPSGDELTLPIGLGITKTVRFGNVPVKMRLEPQYSIIRPDDVGDRVEYSASIRSGDSQPVHSISGSCAAGSWTRQAKRRFGLRCSAPAGAAS